MLLRLHLTEIVNLPSHMSTYRRWRTSSVARRRWRRPLRRLMFSCSKNPHYITQSRIHQTNYQLWFVSLLLFYVLATSKVISGWVPTCDSAHSSWLYGAALGNQAVNSMTWYPTQSHYPDSDLTKVPADHAYVTRCAMLSTSPSLIKSQPSRK